MMTHRLIVLLIHIVITGATVSFGSMEKQWFEQANSLYEKQSYDSAKIVYEKILSLGINNSDVLYNLGNCYARLNSVGKAILCYEKALLLNPTDPDIKANIRFVKAHTSDKTPQEHKSLIEATVGFLHSFFPLKEQLWISFSLLVILSILFSSALFVNRTARLWLLYSAVLLSLIFIGIGVSLTIKITENETVTYAIVIEKSVDAKNQPNGTKILFTIHEGTKFRVRKSVENWSFVSLPNGVSGWVETSTLGFIELI